MKTSVIASILILIPLTICTLTAETNVTLAERYPYQRVRVDGVRGYWRDPVTEFAVAKVLKEYDLLLAEVLDYDTMVENLERQLEIADRRRWKWAALSACGGIVVGIILSK